MPEPAIGSESTEWGTEGGIVDPRSIDEYPIENSRNLVRSGGVYDAILAGGGGSGVDYLTVVNGQICVIYEVTE